MKVLRRIVVAVLLLSMLLMLCACGKFKCATCGEEKTGRFFKEEFFGEKVKICKECKEKGEKLEDIIVDIGDLFE